MDGDPITHNALLYLSLAFLPVLGSRFLLLHRMRCGLSQKRPFRRERCKAEVRQLPIAVVQRHG